MAIIRLALGSSRHPPTPPPYINVGVKEGLISSMVLKIKLCLGW